VIPYDERPGWWPAATGGEADDHDDDQLGMFDIDDAEREFLAAAVSALATRARSAGAERLAGELDTVASTTATLCSAARSADLDLWLLLAETMPGPDGR
jgi:hypothetical protein